MRPGAKYYWWEIRGVPLRLELGPRDIDAGKVMAVTRLGEKTSLDRAGIVDGVKRVLDGISQAMKAKAEEHMKNSLCTAGTVEACTLSLNDERVAVVPWCGDRTCGDAIEEKSNSSILGTEARSPYVSDAGGACVICGKPGRATLVGRTY
jgi:prolyl-tRNA synthetase